MTTAKPDMPHFFTIVLGDYSRDGHGVTETYWYRSNRTHTEIDKAYAAGSRQYDLPLTNQCQEYEDYFWSTKFYNRCLEVFAQSPEVMELLEYSDENDNGRRYADSETFAELFFHIAKLADPDLVWDDVEKKPEIKLGGYGLFIQ